MAKNFVDQQDVPYDDIVLNPDGKLSPNWQKLFRVNQDSLTPLGREQYFTLTNNQSSSADIEGLYFNKSKVGLGIVEYLIQRVTTGSGAIEAIEAGTLYLTYNPTSETWNLFRQTNDKTLEGSSELLNNQASPVDVPGLSFLSSAGSLISIEYVAQRVTVAPGVPVELVQSGILHMVRRPTTPGWDLRHIGSAGPDTSVTFTVTGGGRIRYTTTNITGTSSISKMNYRIKTIGPLTSGVDYIKESDTYSTYLSGITFSITANGQVQYTSSNFSGTSSISKLTYRARTLSAKNSLYSTVGVSR